MSIYLIPLCGILGGLLVAVIGLFYGFKYVQRRQELWHETARLALEKGQPLPAISGRAKPDPQNDIRTGLILIGTGGGTYLALVTLLEPLRFLAAVPGFIGVALLVHATVSAISSRKDKATERSPES